MQLVVIRGVLTEELTIEQGAAKLGLPHAELYRLVMGARRRVIETLGEQALERARQTNAYVAVNAR